MSSQCKACEGMASNDMHTCMDMVDEVSQDEQIRKLEQQLKDNKALLVIKQAALENSRKLIDTYDALLDECEATIDQLLTVYVPYNDISQKGGKELITKIQNRNKP